LLPASTIVWDFRSGSSTASTSTGSGYGNTRTFTNSGVTISVTAWSLTGNNDTFQTAQSGRFSTGLGICNQNEGTGCGDPAHQVDNGLDSVWKQNQPGAEDFMLFNFSSPLEGISIKIDPWNTWDRDVTYFTRNSMTPFSLAGVQLSGLAALGFTGPTHSDSTPSTDIRTVALLPGTSTSVLFGARVDNTDGVDRFKIKWLEGKIPRDDHAVPEPSTFVLLGSALAGIGAFRKFRRR
jgi:hypothetical protein